MKGVNLKCLAPSTPSNPSPSPGQMCFLNHVPSVQMHDFFGCKKSNTWTWIIILNIFSSDFHMLITWKHKLKVSCHCSNMLICNGTYTVSVQFYIHNYKKKKKSLFLDTKCPVSIQFLLPLKSAAHPENSGTGSRKSLFQFKRIWTQS